MSELLFADDAVIIAHSEEYLQRLGLKISLKKTVMMPQGSAELSSKITLDGKRLGNVKRMNDSRSPMTTLFSETRGSKGDRF